jgi:long-chain acyl-CoA synthetase
MLLPELLVQSAERFPEKPALIFPREQTSFGALHLQSSLVAGRLRKLGIGRGDRVAVLYENSVAAVVFFWGVLKSGAQSVDIPLLTGTATINKILAECKPKALVASDRQLRRLTQDECRLPEVILTQGQTQLPINGHSLDEIIATEDNQFPETKAYDWEPALIVYTSGTTGDPKGVMLSHRNLLSNIHASNELMRLTSEDSILVVVPLHFIHGRMQLLTHALIGGTMVFSAGFQFPQKIVEDLRYYGVTGFSGVPYHFSTLLDRTTLGSMLLPDLRYVVITGGALSAHAIARLSEALPRVAIHIAYGQTETAPRITYLSPTEVLSRMGSCGLPLCGVNVEIVDDDGGSLPPGATGEVVVSGPNVMCGYVSGDEVTSEKIDPFGRLHTGDLGRLDSQGYLYIVGRKSELIKSAGERIFPREIESVLDAHPAILESAVLGIPDELLGERIVACIVVDPVAGLNSDEVRRHCLQFLPLVRVPREVRFSSGLPKTSSGKIDRCKLITHYSEIGLAAGSILA